jgi:hypothetical protein
MSKSRIAGVHDIGFFRTIGIALVALAVTAGSITLSLALRSYETSVPSNFIVNLTSAAEAP